MRKTIIGNIECDIVDDSTIISHDSLSIKIEHNGKKVFFTKEWFKELSGGRCINGTSYFHRLIEVTLLRNGIVLYFYLDEAQGTFERLEEVISSFIEIINDEIKEHLK